MAAAMLVLGYVTAVSCRNLAVTAAERERESAEQAMRDRVAGVTHDLVLLAAGREIAQYERFRRELAVASGRRVASSLTFRGLDPADSFIGFSDRPAYADARRIDLRARAQPVDHLR